MHAKLCKWGNSQGIRIPKTILGALDINENEILELTYDTLEKTITLSIPTLTPCQELVGPSTHDEHLSPDEILLRKRREK